MLKTLTRKSAYVGVFALFLAAIISCEKDFTDIGSTVIDNTKFDTNSIILDVEITPKNIESVRADNIVLGNLGQYLLGVYKKGKGNDQKIEASIVSQLLLPSSLAITNTNYTNGEILSDPNIDEIILKIPLQATLNGTETVKINIGGVEKDTVVPVYQLDSLLGNTDQSFTLNVYRNNTFLNKLNPTDPSKNNSFQSNFNYEKIGSILNTNTNFTLKDAEKDSLFVFERTLSTGEKYNDTLKIVNGASIKSNPFKVVRLNKNILKALLFDKYESSELSNQENFEDYFRGIIIEAIGSDGSIVPLDLSNVILTPSIDVIHTTTVMDSNNQVIDTIENINSFLLGGIKNSVYKMDNATNSAANTFIIQGTSGSLAEVKIADNDINTLINQNILVNDATLSFYLNQDNSTVDTVAVPKRLFLHKIDETGHDVISTQISDIFRYGPDVLGGNLELNDNKPDKYNFRITDYFSRLLKGNTNHPLILKVFNVSDIPSSATDSIVNTYNWNPRSVPLLNNNAVNGTRKAQLKISYTTKK